MNFIIGIDGGGTKTVGQIVNTSNNSKIERISGPSSLSQDFEGSVKTLVTLINHLVDDLNAGSESISVALGVAGAGDLTLKTRCEDELKRQIGLSDVMADVVVKEDCETALLGAIEAVGDDVSLITLGTGSFVASCNKNQSVNYTGGWGFPIGDDGSGAKLGFYAVQSFLTLFDQASTEHSQEQTHEHSNDKLYQYFLNSIGQSKSDVLTWLSTSSQSQFADFAPVIFSLESVSELAKNTINKHLDDVYKLLSSVTTKQTLLTGGLAQETLSRLNNQWRERVSYIKEPSLVGAMSLAKKNSLKSTSDINSTLISTVAIDDTRPDDTLLGRTLTDKELTPLNLLVSEQRNQDSSRLDELNSSEIVTLMNQQDQLVIDAINAIRPNISHAIDVIKNTLASGGRLIYIGAGTSGRLGVLDAVECPPTFSSEPAQVVGLLAGGESAMFKAVEGAEDSPLLGQEDLQRLSLSRQDCVVGIAASGRTPYVIGGLNYAKEIGCKTISVTCNPIATINELSDVPLAVNVGPEVLSGSTRLKAGTAQKMILNMLSTGAMVQLGKCYENLMVDVKVSNKKLRKRALGILKQACDLSEAQAELVLESAKDNVKLAILMHKKQLPFETATARLSECSGYLKLALK